MVRLQTYLPVLRTTLLVTAPAVALPPPAPVGPHIVTGPAGSFSARHVVFGGLGGTNEWWLDDKVPGGTVKQLLKDPNEDKDVCFGKVAAGKWAPVRLHAGQLTVFWPEDSHAPKLACGTPSPVMKIVVKIAV